MARLPSPDPVADPLGSGLPPRGARERLRRGIYLLPSLFTTGNIFLGFWAIIRGLRGDFGPAAMAIFAAGFLDAIDGRIARMTGTESDFGKELDSLADVLTFGMAPALLAFLWGLHEFPRVGWLVPLFFVVCGATRLARFNVQTKVVDSRFFAGLPIPAAAGTVVTTLFFDPDRDWRTWMSGFLLVLMACVAFLMVSTFRYRSFKKVDLRRRKSYRFVALFPALVLILVAWKPQIVLFTLALAYAASGPLEWAIGRLRGNRAVPPPPAALALDGEPLRHDPPPPPDRL
jgi:CDP-diacylglycerol--serine O-phosphatidyltransferase